MKRSCNHLQEEEDNETAQDDAGLSEEIGQCIIEVIHSFIHSFVNPSFAHHNMLAVTTLITLLQQ